MTFFQADHSLEIALKAFQCVTGNAIVYASTPLTGGPALLDGMKDCLAFNIGAAQKFVDHVAALSGKTVINPGEFMLDGWKQETYLLLWKTVIEKVASEVWFNEGWQFSNGCAIEFAFACYVGKKTFNIFGLPLNRDTAYPMLVDALYRFRCANLQANGIERALHELESLDE